jgi:hypothetical protein
LRHFRWSFPKASAFVFLRVGAPREQTILTAGGGAAESIH